jgi:myo-inositol 2-dehydrogenase/D-chiro-inositol 1-dehydrogenase/scyllo-inositol 2-dehydrogenase (NAD+)
MKALRLGLVGCGEIAHDVHLHVLPSMPGVTLAALCSRREASLQSARERAPNAATYTSLAEMLSTEKLDAVVVSVPTPAHAEVACTVLEAGIHLYMESPLSDRRDNAQRILDAQERSGCLAMIGLPMYFHPLLQSLKYRLNSGEIGEPLYARFSFCTRPNLHSDWTRDPDQGGGVLLHKATHDIAAARFLFGDIMEVDCRPARPGSDHRSVLLELRFASGFGAQLLASTASLEDRRMEVFGTEGSLGFGWYDSLRVECKPANTAGFGGRARRVLGEFGGLAFLRQKWSAPLNDPSFVLALEAFADAIRHQRKPSPGLEDGMHCLDAVLAARQSIAEGRSIRVRLP